MDYSELVKKLRNRRVCIQSGGDLERDFPVMREAADAIENTSKAYQMMAEAYEAEITKQEWIPVTERLPNDNEAVNVVWVNHSPVFYYQHIKDKPQTATGVYYSGKWYWWSAVAQDYLAEYGKWEPDLIDAAIEVTHWMPLPEPPKEETE